MNSCSRSEYQQVMSRNVFWTPIGDIGLEHLQLSEDRAGIAAESVVVGVRETDPFRIYYELECDRNGAQSASTSQRSVVPRNR